mmetsp:Transcript_34252/g.107471  ORF Transcript_34252/g.107471 Transcript_34252/m.107471 type:complete len:212 (+) Transcript_34252:516-1151(+)
MCTVSYLLPGAACTVARCSLCGLSAGPVHITPVPKCYDCGSAPNTGSVPLQHADARPLGRPRPTACSRCMCRVAAGPVLRRRRRRRPRDPPWSCSRPPRRSSALLPLASPSELPSLVWPPHAEPLGPARSRASPAQPALPGAAWPVARRPSSSRCTRLRASLWAGARRRRNPSRRSGPWTEKVLQPTGSIRCWLERAQQQPTGSIRWAQAG